MITTILPQTQRAIAFFAYLLFSAVFSMAQSGPGGVGTNSENVLWLRSDQGTSTTVNLATVSQWQDISGNANHANQLTPAKMPTFITSSINGLPALRFSGTNVNFVVDDNDNLDNTTGLSIFVVSQPNTIDANPRGLVSKRVSSGSETAYSLFSYTGSNLYFDTPTRMNGTAPVDNSAQVFSAIFNGTDPNFRSRIFQNGSQTGAANAGSNTSIGNMASDLFIGILNDNYGNAFRGDMSEVIIYRSALNQAQRTIVEVYLANRYNIALTNYSYGSTTYNQQFIGVGNVGGDRSISTQDVGSGLQLAESNGSLNTDGEFVFAGHDGTAHGIDNSDLPDITPITLSDRWQRVYYIERQEGGVVDAGSTDISIGFNFAGTGLPTDQSKVYYLLYRSGVTGQFSVVPGGTGAFSNNTVLFNISDANFSSGYFTIAKSDEEVRTWYSFNDGNWNNFNTWSLNPDSPINPGSEIPGGMDKVIIQKSITVTVTDNDISAGVLEVNSGILDFGTTTGQNFSIISAQTTGTVRLAGDNFPVGEASRFADESSGGTVEYYGTGYDLNISRIFRNMRINLTNATDQILLLADYTLNGNLTIERGELQFGNNAFTTPVNLTVQQNIEVSSSSKILTGSGNARHQLNLFGDFTNQGEVQFTNRVAANYTAEANDGIVDVNILSATRNQTIMLEGPSRFYRIAINKGLSNTYEAYIEATDPTYFNLFGYADQGHGDIAQLASNTNSFGLLTGTVRVGPNISIPRLNGGGNYNVSENAILWVDGGTVTKPSGTAVVVYGKVKVSEGTFNALINSGITTRINGTLESTGGTTNLNQFRTSVYGSQHQGGYIQSGGTVNLVSGSLSTDYYRFSLTYSGNVFNMSGGTLHIQQTGGRGGIFINSDEVNQSVTGGTVICDISNANDFIITSKAPFWNLELRKTVANGNDFILDEGVDVGGTDEYLGAQPLKVLRNFYIRGTESGYQGVDFYPVTDATNVNDVYIGGSFYIESGSQYWAAADGNRAANYNSAAALPTIFNTTYFNQTDGTPALAYLYWWNEGDELNYDGNGTNDQDENMAEFGGFVLNRDSGNQLRVASSAGRGDAALTIDVNGDLVIESGTLCQGRFTIRTWASITNNDRLGTYYTSGPYPTASGTPSAAQIRFRESEDSAPIINSSDNAIFGNTRFNVNPNSPFKFQNNMYFERLQLMRGILYLGSYNMKVDDMWDLNNDGNNDTDFFIEGASTSSYLRVVNSGRSTGAGSNQEIMIITDGKASDGGLSLKVTANSLADNAGRIRNNQSLLTFPIGFSTDKFVTGLTNTYYRPAQMKVTNFSDDGYVTVHPVLGVLQTTNAAGGEVLQNHWKVSHTDFSALPTVVFRFYYRNRNASGVVDLPAGAVNEASYVPGKVLDSSPYTRSYESNAVAQQDVDGVFNSPVDANTRVIVFNGPNAAITDDGLFDFSANAPGITLEKAKYTTGVYQRFTGAVQIFYLRQNGNWRTNATWSLTRGGGPAPDYPKAGDIAIIRRFSAGYNGIVEVTNAETCAKVVFDDENGFSSGCPRLWISNANGFNSNFDIVEVAETHQGGVLNGETHGAVVKYDLFEGYAGQFPTGDFGNFNNYPNALVIYTKEGATPTVTLSSQATEYPQVWFDPPSNRTFILPNTPVTFNGMVIVTYGHILRMNTGANGAATFKKRLNIGHSFGTGYFDLAGNAAADQTVTAETNINLYNNGRLRINAPAAGGRIHKIILKNNITMETGCNINLGDGTLANSNATLELAGEGAHTLTGAGTASVTLSRITMNKGISQSNTFSFNWPFTLNGPTNGTTEEKALQLQNGTLNLNNAAIDINLSTGGEDFYIPSTSGLVLQTGRVNLNGANNGIILDGLLRVETGGTINLDGGAGVNNYIEYSASGKATIEVTGGTLTVGSQIRRGTSSADGILKYIQTGGVVTVGKNTAPVGNRGVFEVINNGSRFIQTSGTLIVVRPQTVPTVASVLIEPSLFTVGNSTLQIGNDDTPLGTTITLKSSIELGNLTVTGVNSPTARLMDRSLKLKRDLTIGTGSTFDGTDLFNLTVKRHIVNNGIADLKVDTLFLLGTTTSPSAAMQNVTGSIKVNHLVVEPETSVTLQPASGVEVSGNLFINSGQFIDGGNTIKVLGNVTNNAAHESTDPNAGGILFQGTAIQRVYGTGQFGRLEVDNPTRVQLEGSMTLNNHLTLTNGIFHLQHHGLTLGQNANVIGAGFNANKMIAVYGGGFAPQGVRKNLPVLAGINPANPYNPADPAYTWTFTFPVGSDDGTNRRYMPMDLYVANNSGGGSVNVVPVNDLHLTFSDPDQNLHVLNQYWEVASSGIAQFTALQRNHYTDDAVFGVEADYIGASLYDAQWSKFLESAVPPVIVVVDEANNWINYVHTSVNLTSGDYTAGEPDWIPDQVPTFFSKQDGDWTDPNTWERDDGGVVPANGPVGQIAHIRTAHTVTISSNFRRAYKTTVNGVLELGTTLNHILGYVGGTGTLSIETNSIPTGNYTDFFGCGGGTMEYGGATTYTLSDRYTHYNNLTIKGSGTKTLPSLDMTICGDLRVEGNATLKMVGQASGTRSTYVGGNIRLLDNAFWDMANRNRVLFSGNFTKDNSASFNTIYTNCTFQLMGDDQLIDGDFTGISDFYRLVFAHSSMAELLGPVDVRDLLYLFSGRILTNSTDILRSIKTSPSNGLFQVTNGFVEGPISVNLRSDSPVKYLPVGRNGVRKFVYPLDLPGTIGTWIGEYFNTNPNGAGLNPLSLDDPPLKTISQSEYWRITGPNGVASRIRLTLDGTSDVAAGIGDINDLRIVYWNGAEWQVAGGGASVVGPISGGTISTTGAFTFDGTAQYFTIGTVQTVEIITATITSVNESICESDSYDLEVTIVGNNPPFELDYSIGATNFTESNIGVLNHTITLSLPDLSLGANTITLNAIRDDDSPINTGTILGSGVTVTVYENPTAFNVTSGGDICGGTTTTIHLDGSELGFTYQLYRNAAYFGAELAGTGGALTFTGVDQQGNYTVRAFNSAYTGCLTWMVGTGVVALGSSASAELVQLLTVTPNCEQEEVQLRIAFTGTPPFTFTLTDGQGNTWADLVAPAIDLIGTGPYTYNLTVPDNPVWTAGLPMVFTYTITGMNDAGGCGAGNVVGAGISVDIYKIPETGPQYHIPNDFGI